MIELKAMRWLSRQPLEGYTVDQLLHKVKGMFARDILQPAAEWNYACVCLQEMIDLSAQELKWVGMHGKAVSRSAISAIWRSQASKSAFFLW